jgi:hypothetical protein
MEPQKPQIPTLKDTKAGKKPELKIKGLSALSLMDRVKQFKRKDLAFILSGLGVLFMAPLAEHFMLSPETSEPNGAFKEGWGFRDASGQLGKSGPYEPGVSGLAPGSLLGGGGDIITPLNVRDPSALVMGPGASQQAPVTSQAASTPPPSSASSSKPSSDWKDALANAASKGAKEATRAASLPVPKIPLQGGLRGLGALSGGGGGGSFSLAPISASNVPNSPTGSRSLTGVTDKNFKGLATRGPNVGGGGSLENLKKAADAAGSKFGASGSAARDLDNAAAASQIGNGADGNGAGGAGGGNSAAEKQTSGNNNQGGRSQGEGLEFMIAKERAMKALEREQKRIEKSLLSSGYAWEMFGSELLGESLKTLLNKGFMEPIASCIGKAMTPGESCRPDPAAAPGFTCAGDAQGKPTGKQQWYASGETNDGKKSDTNGKTKGYCMIPGRDYLYNVVQGKCDASLGAIASICRSAPKGPGDKEATEAGPNARQPALSDPEMSTQGLVDACQQLKIYQSEINKPTPAAAAPAAGTAGGANAPIAGRTDVDAADKDKIVAAVAKYISATEKLISAGAGLNKGEAGCDVNATPVDSQQAGKTAYDILKQTDSDLQGSMTGVGALANKHLPEMLTRVTDVYTTTDAKYNEIKKAFEGETGIEKADEEIAKLKGELADLETRIKTATASQSKTDQDGTPLATLQSKKQAKETELGKADGEPEAWTGAFKKWGDARQKALEVAESINDDDAEKSAAKLSAPFAKDPMSETYKGVAQTVPDQLAKIKETLGRVGDYGKGKPEDVGGGLKAIKELIKGGANDASQGEVSYTKIKTPHPSLKAARDQVQKSVKVTGEVLAGPIGDTYNVAEGRYKQQAALLYKAMDQKDPAVKGTPFAPRTLSSINAAFNVTAANEANSVSQSPLPQGVTAKPSYAQFGLTAEKILSEMDPNKIQAKAVAGPAGATTAPAAPAATPAAGADSSYSGGKRKEIYEANLATLKAIGKDGSTDTGASVRKDMVDVQGGASGALKDYLEKTK